MVFSPTAKPFAVLLLLCLIGAVPTPAPKPTRSDVSSGGTPAFAFEDPSAKTPAGPADGAVALSLSSYGPGYHLGQPIWVVLELRNVSGQMVGGVWQEMPWTYDFKIVDKRNGASLPPIGREDLRAATGLRGDFTFVPGFSTFAGIRLDALYRFTEPGHYSVQLVDARATQFSPSQKTLRLSSNTIMIDVLPQATPAARPTAEPRCPPEVCGSEGAGPIGRGTAGTAKNGLALALTQGEDPVYRLGSDIDVRLELRNESWRTPNVAYDSVPSSYAFTVISQQTGKTLRSGPASIASAKPAHAAAGGLRMPAESSRYGTFSLGKLYRLTQPGYYFVRATGTPIVNGKPLPLKSDTIAINVLPALPPDFGDSVFKVHLESDKTTYRVGERITLRLSVTNVTNETYMLSPQPPPVLTRLLVTDANGHPIAPPSGRGERGTMFSTDYAPGQTRQYEWTDLREWYGEPLASGTYTLFAIANIRGARRLPSGALRDWFHTTDEDRSNPVTIRIVP